MQQQRRWEAEQARSAPRHDAPEDIETELGISENTPPTSHTVESSARIPQQNSAHEVDDEELNQLLRQEDEDLDALVSLMGHEDQLGRRDDDGQQYGSDDEDYDSIFMDVIASECDGHDRVYRGGGVQDGDSMDTSNG